MGQKIHFVDDKCDDCIFAVINIYDDGELGYKCRRYPPTLYVDRDGGLSQAYPNAWKTCGEYIRREEDA